MRLIILILLIINCTQVHAIEYYNIGDKLFVWASSGLKVRLAPDMKSQSIGKLEYSESIIAKSQKVCCFAGNVEVQHQQSLMIKGKLYPEVIFKGSWLVIEYEGKEGFVFDGYLSRYKPFTKPTNTDLGKLSTYLSSSIGLLKSDSIRFNNDHEVVLHVFEDGISIKEDRTMCTFETVVMPMISLEEVFLMAERGLFHYEQEKILIINQSEDKWGHKLIEMESGFMFTGMRIWYIKGVVIITTGSCC